MELISTPKRSLLYVLAVLLILALTALTVIYVRQTIKVRRSKGWVTHTIRAINRSEKLLRLATQEAMAHRGFILTRDSSLLKPSFAARRIIFSELDSLQGFIADNPRQLNTLNVIRQLIIRRIDFSDSTNNIRLVDSTRARQMVLDGAGAALMDSIEDRLSGFQLEQYRLLQERQANETVASSVLTNILLALLLSVLAFLVLFFVLLRKYITSQDRLIDESQYTTSLLRKFNDAVILLDGQFIITGWNPGAEAVYGVPASEAIGKSIRELITLTKSDFPESGFDALLQQGQWHGEIHKYSLRGDEKYLLASISLIRNNKNEPAGSVAVMRDITQRKRQEKLLAETNEDLETLLDEQLQQNIEARRKLRDMNTRIEVTREEERKRISRELHDDLGQMLTGAKIHLSYIVEELNVQEPEMQRMLTNLVDILDKSIQSVRSISMELRPGLVEELGLFGAMKFHADRFTRQTQIAVDITNDVEELELDHNYAFHIFRIFQEALNNVAKHANATNVRTMITIDEGILKLTISDNGRGFEVGTVERKTLGLTSMEERSAIIHGKCRIESRKGEGTVVHVDVPLLM